MAPFIDDSLKRHLNLIDVYKRQLQACQNSARSFLIPQDFGFLKRGGRISSVSATLGGMLHVVPLVCHSLDGLTLEKFGIKRTYQGAVSYTHLDVYKRQL